MLLCLCKNRRYLLYKDIAKDVKKDLTLQILGRRLFEEKNFKKSNWINERLIR